jgi:hypothetical protein
VKTNGKADPNGDDLSDDDVAGEPEDDTIPEAVIEEVAVDEPSRSAPETAKERAMEAFYQDPERVIKLFLTSYAYDKGVYWYVVSSEGLNIHVNYNNWIWTY